MDDISTARPSPLTATRQTFGRPPPTPDPFVPLMPRSTQRHYSQAKAAPARPTGNQYEQSATDPLMPTRRTAQPNKTGVCRPVLPYTTQSVHLFRIFETECAVGSLRTSSGCVATKAQRESEGCEWPNRKAWQQDGHAPDRPSYCRDAMALVAGYEESR